MLQYAAFILFRARAGDYLGREITHTIPTIPKIAGCNNINKLRA
jgi:hypothetical protein